RAVEQLPVLRERDHHRQRPRQRAVRATDGPPPLGRRAVGPAGPHRPQRAGAEPGRRPEHAHAHGAGAGRGRPRGARPPWPPWRPPLRGAGRAVGVAGAGGGRGRPPRRALPRPRDGLGLRRSPPPLARTLAAARTSLAGVRTRALSPGPRNSGAGPAVGSAPALAAPSTRPPPRPYSSVIP